MCQVSGVSLYYALDITLSVVHTAGLVQSRTYTTMVLDV